ncbi:hypothetical protein BK749_12810 [Bacillus thuringiensis serovar vazensis]|uniref:Uncharacterized protein n=1 Tax=Bacillus thuringiensis serovar vazensis TaxID=180867 RepID=A0A243CZ95_BACTU|nr:hypothetical protein bthur0012_60110 [Bacillus thuringiensis serovar pulsiensis BGSC 4CC1]OTY76126.1 hypothetical protein BK749_12810 [Bacillus thuringiensis serovar vazensis]
MGRMLLVLAKEYVTWEKCCSFCIKSTQGGKGVACFAERVRKMGKMLHVLQKGYAKWERCCMFYRKGTQSGKDVARFAGRVRKVGKMLLNIHLVERDFTNL